MSSTTEIKDVAIWFKDIDEPKLLARLRGMVSEETVTLEADNVVGCWVRMKDGRDGRPTFGIRPVGEMKSVWNNWFKSRKGEFITLREVRLADEYLAVSSKMFSEWDSPEDERAFHDL